MTEAEKLAILKTTCSSELVGTIRFWDFCWKVQKSL